VIAMRRTVAILGLVSGIAAAPAVWAGDEMVSPTWPPPPPARPPEPAEGDFGWQVLTADLAGLAGGHDEDGCGSLGLILGVVIGFGAAWALDSTYLSHPDRAPPGPAIQVIPAVDPNRMFSLVLSGRF
jgi:hypothetical protein